MAVSQLLFSTIPPVVAATAAITMTASGSRAASTNAGSASSIDTAIPKAIGLRALTQ